MSRILIVEDDNVICSLLSDILKVYGQVIEAHNLTEVEYRISNQTFDLLIADYYLGETDGLSVVKLIQSKLGQIPTILISAYPTIDMLTNSIDLKINCFIRKPIDFDLLIKKIESIILHDQHFLFNDKRIILMKSCFKIRIDSEEYELTDIQFKIMSFFLEHIDKTIEREKIVDIIWGSKRINSMNTFDSHLFNLKKKIPFLKDHLRTIPRIGYILSQKIIPEN